MAHIPYYNEQEVMYTPCGKIKRRNNMIMNYKQLVEHNKQFWDSFVDLKTVGWNTYSKALNAYTMNFFKEQLDIMDKAVEQTANAMKGKTNGK